MGISHRMFLIDSEDCLYRLPTSTFQAMLQAPVLRRYPQFSGQRVRTASICVELVDRRPTEIVRATFDILTFDEDGYFERDLYLQQQSSRAELAMAPVISVPSNNTDVVDAASRFIAHGGCWIPSRSLACAIGMPRWRARGVPDCKIGKKSAVHQVALPLFDRFGFQGGIRAIRRALARLHF